MNENQRLVYNLALFIPRREGNTIKTAIQQKKRYRYRVGPRQEALNLDFMRTVAHCPPGKNGRVVQIWARHTDLATGLSCFMPVSFFDDDSLEEHLKKTWARSFLTEEKSREMYFTINKFYPWRAGQTDGIKDGSRCAYADVLYVDVDLHAQTTKIPLVRVLADVKAVLNRSMDAGRLPECSVTATGRGFGLFWLLGSPYNPNSEAARYKYRALGEALAERVSYELRAFGGLAEVDPAVVGDMARVARIPGTFNPKARTYCAAVKVSKKRYSEEELAAALGIKLRADTVHDLPTMAAAYQGGEIERLAAYAAENPIERGRRYIFLWTAAECLLRDHPQATAEDEARLAELNRGLPEPLADRELAHALAVAERAARSGKLPKSETVADRLGLSDEQRVRYGLGDGHRGLKPMGGARVSVPVDGVRGLLLEARACRTLPEQYAALERVQPLLSPAVRAELKEADKALYAWLTARETKQRARPFAELARRGDWDGLRELREQHTSNATRDAQRAERKAERAAAKQAEEERRAAKAARWDKLRELKAAGLTQKEIAAQLGVNLRTVKRHWND